MIFLHLVNLLFELANKHLIQKNKKEKESKEESKEESKNIWPYLLHFKLILN